MAGATSEVFHREMEGRKIYSSYPPPSLPPFPSPLCQDAPTHAQNSCSLMFICFFTKSGMHDLNFSLSGVVTNSPLPCSSTIFCGRNISLIRGVLGSHVRSLRWAPCVYIVRLVLLKLYSDTALTKEKDPSANHGPRIWPADQSQPYMQPLIILLRDDDSSWPLPLWYYSWGLTWYAWYLFLFDNERDDAFCISFQVFLKQWDRWKKWNYKLKYIQHCYYIACMQRILARIICSYFPLRLQGYLY